MMEKLRLKYPVIVEGRYDKAKLASLLEGDIIETGGFRIFSDKEKLALIQALAKKGKVVLLTDSDRAGYRIRGHIAGAVPPKAIVHVFIPEVLGKERRKKRPSAEGTLGVEGMEADLLRARLMEAGALEGEAEAGRQEITRGDLYSLGLTGREGSAELRRAVLRKLGLPGGVSSGALPGILSRVTTREELEEAIRAVRKELSDPGPDAPCAAGSHGPSHG